MLSYKVIHCLRNVAECFYERKTGLNSKGFLSVFVMVWFNYVASRATGFQLSDRSVRGAGGGGGRYS